MLKLDKYDKKLLYELDKKANLPLSVLASKLHRSKQVILYRMKKLEEDGIITGYHAIVDMAKLGYFSFRIYLRFHQTTEEEEKQFVALCPELDVVSQGYTIEEAIKNLKEACELYIGEMGVPEGISPGDILVTSFGVKINEVTKVIGA